LLRTILYIKARLRRGRSIRSMGPNEARIVFDAGVGFVAAIISAVVCAVFVNKAILPGREILAISSLPVLLLLFNSLFGIYSRLKTARARHKALALLASVVCTSSVGWALAQDPAPAVL
jgi:hypothetical protein